MARPLRLEYPGAVYHVMARGHERSAVFRDDGHRERFLGLLGSVSRDEGWEIHGYCLMGNHYHLLVGTPLGKLSRGIKAVNGRYARWFNWRQGGSRSRQEIAPIATKGRSGEVGCAPSKPEDKGASLLDPIPTIYSRAECGVRWLRRKWITASPYGPSLENLE